VKEYCNRANKEHNSEKRDEPPVKSFYERILLLNGGAEHRLEPGSLAIEYRLRNRASVDEH
jgi:hypothetical protein